MKKKRICTLFLLSALTFLLIGCSGKSVGILETGKTYIGGFGTNEIIEVVEPNKWTIKNKHKDDTNYTIASISETGEKIGDYPVFRIVGEEIYGDLDSVFAEREGVDYIYVEDEEGVYFESLTKSSREELAKGLSETKDSDGYVKETALYKFKKQ